MNLTNDIYQRIATAKIFIDENYHESIGLEDISQQAFLSRFHFHRLFTKIYRSTPHRYLTQKRIEKSEAAAFRKQSHQRRMQRSRIRKSWIIQRFV